MPRAGEPCARREGHPGKHWTSAYMNRKRDWTRAWREDPKTRRAELDRKNARRRERYAEDDSYRQQILAHQGQTLAGLLADIRTKINQRRKALENEF